ncbi:hypothetical protein [Vineibacter terrae]|uniref:hypothetical protein n=1 Tax=Vineibacter terrae TaxID=2586908 RepID=UPI002E37F9AE|nr:hypothetical protein [Vineibacter terrae]HEX2886185.1 hypothetical protein [Vineibacter terrae]
MRVRTSFTLTLAAVLALPAMTNAAESERVVWRGSYTAPYSVVADCLAQKMSGDYGMSAAVRTLTYRIQVGLWREGTRRGLPVAAFYIQPAGDGPVEITWSRSDRLGNDTLRLDEAARNAAIDCGGRSA